MASMLALASTRKSEVIHRPSKINTREFLFINFIYLFIYPFIHPGV
jgi:hypothetical protein